MRFCININTFVSRSHYSCNNVLDKGLKCDELIISEYKDQMRNTKKSLSILFQTQSINVKSLQVQSTMRGIPIRTYFQGYNLPVSRNSMKVLKVAISLLQCWKIEYNKSLSKGIDIPGRRIFRSLWGWRLQGYLWIAF